MSEYQRVFDQFRDKPLRLLEIGVQNGGSLEIWSKYFTNAITLTGCDVNPKCGELIFGEPRIKVFVGDANEIETQRQILKHCSQYDIIIDDGSHSSIDIVKSFASYFPHLADDGLFIAEDLHCSYWENYEGGLLHPYSSISFFKRLVDVVNHEHWGVPRLRSNILEGFFSRFDCDINEETLSQVHSVEFVNSMCIVRKAKSHLNTLGHHVVVGSLEEVSTESLELNGRPYDLVFDESRNPWTERKTPPDEAIFAMEIEQANLRQEVAELKHEIASIRNSNSWRITEPLRYFFAIFKSLKTKASD